MLRRPSAVRSPSRPALTEALEPRRLLAASPEILFIRGADRSGGFLEASNDYGRTEQLADINNAETWSGNHGWKQLADTLRSNGFAVSQITESVEPGAPSTGQTQGVAVDLAAMDLSRYATIVFGSNNAAYSAASVDALENYVRNGGSALFISDANFGSDWADASNSDQPFLSRFGITVNQDHGTYLVQRSAGDYLAPSHPVLKNVNTFDGEGVTPMRVSNANVPGVAATVVARAKGNTRVNAPPYANNSTRQGQLRSTTSADASLLVATANAGRIAGHFDRNTFFNQNGAGTDITRFDNRAYAVNLFRWLAVGDDATPPTLAAGRLASNEAIFTFDEAVNATLNASTLTLTRVGDGQSFPIPSTRRPLQDQVALTLPSNLPDGHYRATLAASAVTDIAGNALAAPASFDFLYVPTGHTLQSAATVSDLHLATGATLDLSTHALRVLSPSGAERGVLIALLNDAHASGTWSAPGITSAPAANDPLRLQSVGYKMDGPDLLIAPTTLGDADLDLDVDEDDYARITYGQATGAAPTWSAGDFNYDAAIDADDFSLADYAFAARSSAGPTAAEPEDAPEAELATDLLRDSPA